MSRTYRFTLSVYLRASFCLKLKYLLLSNRASQSDRGSMVVIYCDYSAAMMANINGNLDSILQVHVPNYKLIK